MKRTRPSDIKHLLAERDIVPSRVLGQNFLIDENILKIILDSAHLDKSDAVLEIGPGLGVLTEHLLLFAGRVIAIEKDPRLSAYLRDTFGPTPSFTLIEDDALNQDLPTLLVRESITHVISNLPYSAGTRILMELIEAGARPLRMVVMLQSDVAERLIAKPGSKTYGITSIHAQLYYDVILRKSVSPSCFYPAPEVRSSIVEFYRRPEPLVQLATPVFFKELVKWCFSQRRKQLGRILQDAPHSLIPTGTDVLHVLESLDLQPTQRPESLSVEDWGRLANGLGECRMQNADFRMGRH